MGLFSSEPHPIEKLVKEATAETLTSEDWSKIIAVCDEINTKPSKEGPIAVQALRTRLALPNGNIQLYSLTLLNAIAQNCGPLLQREIASSATSQVLLKLGTSPATHRTVIIRLLDVLRSLVEEFSSDSTLSQVEQVYKRVSSAHPSLAKADRSDSHSSASRHQASHQKSPSNDDADADLKLAIELSIKESQQQPTPAAEIARAAQLPDTTPKTYVRGLYDFTASEDGELSFKTGDIIEVVDRVYKEWWKGFINGREGIFPVNYVEPYTPPGSDANSETASAKTPATRTPAPTKSEETTSESFTNPAVMDEEYLFAQVPAVEKLLTILASASQDGNGSSVISNVDVQRLYHQISAMRPRLIQLIDEYTLKKEELVDMNQKLLTARRNYEKLVSEAASGYNRHPLAAGSTVQSRYGQQTYQPPPAQAQYSGPYQQQQHPVEPQYSGQSQSSARPQSAVPQSGHFPAQQPYNSPPVQQQPPVAPSYQPQSLPQTVPNYPPTQPKSYDRPEAFRQSQLYQPYQTPPSQPREYQSPTLPSQATQAQPLETSHYPQAYQSQEYDARNANTQQLPYPDDQARVQNPYTNGVVTPSAPRPY